MRRAWVSWVTVSATIRPGQAQCFDSNYVFDVSLGQLLGVLALCGTVRVPPEVECSRYMARIMDMIVASKKPCQPDLLSARL